MILCPGPNVSSPIAEIFSFKNEKGECSRNSATHASQFSNIFPLHYFHLQIICVYVQEPQPVEQFFYSKFGVSNTWKTQYNCSSQPSLLSRLTIKIHLKKKKSKISTETILSNFFLIKCYDFKNCFTVHWLLHSKRLNSIRCLYTHASTTNTHTI